MDCLSVVLYELQKDFVLVYLAIGWRFPRRAVLFPVVSYRMSLVTREKCAENALKSVLS